jgi:hypothetical protein
MNTYAGLVIAGYLILVIANGNEKELVSMLSKEGDFAKWGLSLGVLYLVAGQMGETGSRMMLLVYVAMALIAVRKNPKALSNITDILKV